MSKDFEIPILDELVGRDHACKFYVHLGHEDYGVTEMRALGPKGPWVAYVDDADSFVELAMRAEREGLDVYVGLQPRPCVLFEHAPNEWRVARGGPNGNVASGTDIEFITIVAFDIDSCTAARRSGFPASDEELRTCIAVGERFMQLEGFAKTAGLMLSGNGVHVINPIEPVDVDDDVPGKLRALERECVSEVGPLPLDVRIDSISDLPRIIRVPGVLNRKGRTAPNRPHRRACILAEPPTPKRSQVVADRIRFMGVSPSESDASQNRPLTRIHHGDIDRFKGCEFVQWMARDAKSVPEPAWQDFLGQCAHLEGGDVVAHEISSLDAERYAPAQTQARLERIRRIGYRPKRCERLNGPDGNFRCPRMAACPAQRPIELAATVNRKEIHVTRSPEPESQGKRPYYTSQCGTIELTAWLNLREVGGEMREFLDLEVAKHYRDGQGNPQKARRFRPEELPALIAVAKRALDDLGIRQAWPAAELETAAHGKAPTNDT
jgi:hypothetical protein